MLCLLVQTQSHRLLRGVVRYSKRNGISRSVIYAVVNLHTRHIGVLRSFDGYLIASHFPYQQRLNSFLRSGRHEALVRTFIIEVERQLHIAGYATIRNFPTIGVTGDGL